MIGKFKFVIEADNMGPTIIWEKTAVDALSAFIEKYPAAVNGIAYTNKEWLKKNKKPKKVQTPEEPNAQL